MISGLSSFWEEQQTNFLTESNDSVTIHYKPERTGSDESFDSFFQESTNPADPTGSHFGTAGTIILNSDDDDYYVASSVSVPESFSVSVDLYITSDPSGCVISISENADLSVGDFIILTVAKRISYSSYYVTLTVDNSVLASQFFGTNSNGDYFNYNTWYTFTISKSGSTYTLTYSGGSGDVVDGLGIDVSGLDYLSLLSYANGGNALVGLPRVRNLSGDILKFGLAYTDTAETALATVGQDVASIKNAGTMGGSFVQDTAGNRADLYTGSDNTESLSETTPDTVTVSNGKTHLDLQGTTMGSTESDQQIDIGKFSDADALFTCLLSSIQISTNPDPIVTLFDDDVDSVKYVVVTKDGKRYDIQGVRPRGMGSTPFVVDVFLKITNKEV